MLSDRKKKKEEHKGKFSLNRNSTQIRIGGYLILITTLFYVISFGTLHEKMGNGVSMLSMIPVLLIGLFFGMKAGILGGLMFAILDIALLDYFFIASPQDVFSSGILFGAIALLVVGGVMGYMSDLRQKFLKEIDQRKKIEQELEKERSRAYAILNEQQDLVCRINQNFQLTYVNPATCQFLGIPENSLLDMKLTVFFEKEEVFNLRMKVKQVVSDENPSQIELPLRDRNNDLHYIQWAVSPIKDSSQAIQEFQVIGRDITEQKIAQQAEMEQRAIVEALKNSAAILNSTLDLDAVLQHILETIGEVLEHDGANIMLVENQHARMVNLIGYEKFVGDMEVFRGLQFPLTINNFHQMILTDQPVVIPDTHNHPDWVKLEGNEWIRSYIGAPLVYQGKLIGFINLDSTIPGFYKEKYAAWLQAFADQAAIAVKNAQLYEEVNERARQLSLLNQATRVAIHATQIEDICKPIAQLIQEIFKTDSNEILIWQENGNSFFNVFPDDCEIRREALNTEDIEFQNKIASKVLNNSQILIIDNLEDDIEFSSSFLKKFNLVSVVFLPLLVDDRKLGVIVLGYKGKRVFQHHEVLMMEQFSRQTSLAIAKSNMLQHERERTRLLEHSNRLLETMTRITGLVDLKFDMDQIFSNMGSELQKIGVDCLIALKNSENHTLEVPYSSVRSILSRYSGKTVSTIRNIISFEHLPTAEFKTLFSEQRTVFVSSALDYIGTVMGNDLPENLIPLLSRIRINEDTRAFILPLVINEEPVGLIVLWSRDFYKTDASTVSLFGKQIAITLDKARLYQQIQQLAITDSLTGFYNRRGLEELGNHEMDRAVRFGSNLAAMMIDIDHFKKINDSYGHLVGDEILVQLAHRFRTRLRDVDILCRYGGEEFFFLLTETELGDALKVAERLRNHVQMDPYSTSVGLLNITISIGVSQVSDVTRTLDDLINASDSALYQAKQNGRNLVEYLA